MLGSVSRLKQFRPGENIPGFGALRRVPCIPGARKVDVNASRDRGVDCSGPDGAFARLESMFAQQCCVVVKSEPLV